MHKKIVGLGLLFCLIGFGPLLASSDEVNIQGSWYDAHGSLRGHVSGDAASWSWGGYNYDSTRSNVSFLQNTDIAGLSSWDNAVVKLGSITFSNLDRESSRGEKVWASLNLSLLVEGYAPVNQELLFIVNNNPKKDGADRADSIALSEPYDLVFTLGSYAYTLTLLGFSSDGLNVDAAPFTFSVAEGASATRHLLASVSRTAVPIPPTAILLGSGLLGLLGFRRRA